MESPSETIVTDVILKGVYLNPYTVDTGYTGIGYNAIRL